MKKHAFLFVAVLLGATTAFAQESRLPVSLGVKVGVPVTDMFSASNTTLGSNQIPGSNYRSSVPHYTVGLSSEFKLPYHLGFEVDALYKRGGFNSSTPLGSSFTYTATSFTHWEFPALFKYNLSVGHYRPFIDFGASLRHISGIDQTSYASAILGVSSDNASELQNQTSFGGVAGFGIEAHKKQKASDFKGARLFVVAYP